MRSAAGSTRNAQQSSAATTKIGVRSSPAASRQSPTITTEHILDEANTVLGRTDLMHGNQIDDVAPAPI
jgi:hypothetical protein